MSQVLTALKLVVADLAKLEIPTYATAVAGVLVPIILGITGTNFDPAVLAGYVTLVGTVAGVVQKIFSGQAAAAKK